MPKTNGQPFRWVETEAAKHTTSDSIRQRIAFEEKQIHALESAGFSQDMAKAREAHSELMQILSECLARTGKQSP